MEEKNTTMGTTETMEDYKEALEASYRRIRPGDIVTGTVIDVNDQDVTSDLSVYETNMNLLYDKLTALGFEVERPGGTFYIFPKALEEDANAFCMKAREFDLLLVPSDSFGVKGYVRLAYCIDTEKVKRSLPAFEKLAAAYRK